MNKLKPRKNEKEERLNFVEYWADYVRTHDDETWSRQQNILLNSQLHSAKNLKLSAKEYLDIKGEVCSRKFSELAGS